MIAGIEGEKTSSSTYLAESEAPLRLLLQEVVHLLPTQGPIEVFVHHNTLHAFEEQNFHDAVIKAHYRFDAEPYLSEACYRTLLANGRITIDHLQVAIKQGLTTEESLRTDSSSINNSSKSSFWIDAIDCRERIRLAMLQLPVHVTSVAEVQWALREMQSPQQLPERQRLWKSCLQAGLNHSRTSVRKRASSPIAHREQTQYIRPRDLLLHATGEDIDRYVHDLLIRFSAAFVDQGYSEWTLPNREKGLWKSFLDVYSQPAFAAARWLRGFSAELAALADSKTSPASSIEDSLSKLGVIDAEREEFILQTLLSIRGWAGMIWQLESSVDWVVRRLPPDSLLEFLAIELLLEVRAFTYFGSKSLGTRADIAHVLHAAANRSQVHELDSQTDAQVIAFTLFQLAEKLGWTSKQLESLSRRDWGMLIQEIRTFSSLSRRRVFHEAYESRYRREALDAFAAHTKRLREAGNADRPGSTRPTFQIVCCIDDREESFRRHLEEVDPLSESFGAAGFFAVAMYYRGATDGFYKPLCPGVITPEHYVQEDVGYTFAGVHRSRAQLRERLGFLSHLFETRSRTFLGGMVTGLAGSLAGIPLVARVLFPRLTSRIQQRFGAMLQPPVTKLQLERYADDPGPENGHIGYSVEEMAGVVVRLLQDIGLTNSDRFSRLVVVCGHGSSSLNNPHESAYCCGACAGKRGGPNARAFAEMANDWRVRSLVAAAGIQIPDDTVFVGAYHNTCDDSVVFFDLDSLPSSHRVDFEAARSSIEEARRRNAHERCRRFNNAPLTISPDEALQHVEARAQDISQVRPEYNHATNAMCIVGRRDWHRGLFMDRRAFLTSYDPTQDDADSSILFRILSAAIPVCAGINLEYYFSCVDHVKYGSGSKLPHNIVSLLGVMEGTSSDLRTGLYQQMVEIHEPLRLLFLIESTTEAMLSIMNRNPAIGRLCRGGWVHLAVIDPATSDIQVFDGENFAPYCPDHETIQLKRSSLDCYRGSRDHLPFFSISASKG